jgi:hypothetical protein
MGGFFDDLWSGFKSVPVAIYDKVIEPVGSKAWSFASHSLDRLDQFGNAATNAAEGIGKGIGGLGDILSGNSNILLYAGLGIVGIIVLPKLIDRIL